MIVAYEGIIPDASIHGFVADVADHKIIPEKARALIISQRSSNGQPPPEKLYAGIRQQLNDQQWRIFVSASQTLPFMPELSLPVAEALAVSIKDNLSFAEWRVLNDEAHSSEPSEYSQIRSVFYAANQFDQAPGDIIGQIEADEVIARADRGEITFAEARQVVNAICDRSKSTPPSTWQRRIDEIRGKLADGLITREEAQKNVNDVYESLREAAAKKDTNAWYAQMANS